MTAATYVGIPIPPCIDCGTATVLVISPGSDHEHALEGGIIIARGEPARAWCEPCARAAGWPNCWPSERRAA